MVLTCCSNIAIVPSLPTAVLLGVLTARRQKAARQEAARQELQDPIWTTARLCSSSQAEAWRFPRWTGTKGGRRS